MCVRFIGTSERWEAMARVGLFVHSYSLFIHRFYQATHCFEQGVSSLSTDKRSGYYDYRYIYRSRCETNISLNWGTQ